MEGPEASHPGDTKWRTERETLRWCSHRKSGTGGRTLHTAVATGHRKETNTGQDRESNQTGHRTELDTWSLHPAKVRSFNSQNCRVKDKHTFLLVCLWKPLLTPVFLYLTCSVRGEPPRQSRMSVTPVVQKLKWNYIGFLRDAKKKAQKERKEGHRNLVPLKGSCLCHKIQAKERW